MSFGDVHHAQYEIVHTKVCNSWQGWNNCQIPEFGYSSRKKSLFIIEYGVILPFESVKRPVSISPLFLSCDSE